MGIATRFYPTLYRGKESHGKRIVRLNTEVRRETRKKIEKVRIDDYVARRKQISRCEKDGETK